MHKGRHSGAKAALNGRRGSQSTQTHSRDGVCDSDCLQWLQQSAQGLRQCCCCKLLGTEDCLQLFIQLQLAQIRLRGPVAAAITKQAAHEASRVSACRPACRTWQQVGMPLTLGSTGQAAAAHTQLQDVNVAGLK